MRYFILFCAAGCLAAADEVRADSPDCEAIRTTLIPYQVKLTKEHPVSRELHTVQVARDPSGSEAVSTSVIASQQLKRKLAVSNRMVVSADIQYDSGNQHTRIAHSTYEYAGLDPKPLDFKIDQNFSIKEKWEWFNDKTGERSMDVSYKYLKTEAVTIGDCSFIAHLGEQTYFNKKTGNTGGKSFVWHFPDLRLTVGNPNPDVTFQSIGTTFDPIEFAEPNWPLPPSKLDDH